MHKFILHIGRHKTGTSSLQRFLHENRKALLELGYYYPPGPKTDINHRSIARIFAKKLREKAPTLATEEAEVVNRFLREIADVKVPVLVSSEGFQNALPTAVATLFPAGQTKIIVYIREQVDYILSGYQQEIHATDCFLSLEEWVDHRLPVDYDNFLRSWEYVYGAASLEVRCYSREMLKEGDIIADFLDALELRETSGLTFNKRDQNPSIGGQVLEFKRLLNAINDGSIDPGRLYRVLSNIAATCEKYRERPSIPDAKAAEIRRSAQPSNRIVFDRYFGGRDVFEVSSKKRHAPGSAQGGIDLVEILSAIKSIDRKVYDQIAQRFIAVLPVALNLMKLRSSQPGLDALVANPDVLTFLRNS